MACGEIHQDTIDFEFRCTIYTNCAILDISTATVKQIIFMRPDGVKLTVTASFYTDGTDGKIYYRTVSGDLSMPGLWSMQGYIEMGSGQFYSGHSKF